MPDLNFEYSENHLPDQTCLIAELGPLTVSITEQAEAPGVYDVVIKLGPETAPINDIKGFSFEAGEGQEVGDGLESAIAIAQVTARRMVEKLLADLTFATFPDELIPSN